jgi:mannosyl-oligosaccharide alpha-1,2-mannosidase
MSAADSYYEYLIKEHLLLGGGVDTYGRMWADAMEGAAKHLMANVQVVPHQTLLVLGENR